MKGKKTVLNYLEIELKTILMGIDEKFFENIQEIRLRTNRPLIIVHKETEYFIDINANLCTSLTNAYKPTILQIQKSLELISEHSLYAFNEELKNGYITLLGGHRVGLTGRTVIENGKVKTLKNINGLNIRISHEIKGCSSSIIKYMVESEVLNTMIISPPGCGKTTLLRDIIRSISDGIPNIINGQAVGVVDERSEIAGCYKGNPQNDVGIRTDVLDSCPKAEGMIMLLRAMSPKVIAVDEIGKNEDIYAIESIINAGIKLICTVHGYSIGNIQDKEVFRDLLKRKIFKRYIVLKNVGIIKSIYNENFEQIK
jgi:stage III sporulation protein AA